MISALVLAAGAGERLGGPKALAVLAGQPLLERVVRTCAASSVDEIVVVTGASAHEVEALVVELARSLPDARLRAVRNDGWREGRTGSLQAGWRSCADGTHALVFPVDHPCVRLTTLDAMLGAFGYAAADLAVMLPVVVVDGTRRRGHPVLLSASLHAEALALSPDEPLRDLVHRHVPLELPVDDPGILVDIDTPQDLAAAHALIGG